MPMRYLTHKLGRLGSLLLTLSLIGSCELANPAAPSEIPATRIEPAHAPTSPPPPREAVAATASSPVPVTNTSPPPTSCSSSEPVALTAEVGIENLATPLGTNGNDRFPDLVTSRIRPADGMVMVYVPGGTFPMGSTEGDPEANLDEMPRHVVTLDDFWIDQTEVTNTQFVQFLNERGNRGPQGAKMLVLDEGYTQISQEGDRFLTTEAALNRPVVMVTWHGAASYCEWAGGRLPTEAEWEYAARGPGGNLYPWGNEPPTCDLANYGTCVGVPLDAGSRPMGASWCGALDMAGNVWEWVSDWFGTYPDLPQDNPAGPASGDVPVLRGGGWHSPRWELRTTHRQHEIRASGFNG